MNLKNALKTSILALLCISSLSMAGCGAKENVSFSQYSGTYDGKSYSIAASTWEKQEDEEGFESVWKLVGEVKYDENSGKVLYYGSADTQHFIAITINAAEGVQPENPTYKIDEKTLKPFDNGNQKTFTLIKAISAQSKDFTLTLKWNSDSEVKYKFLINQGDFTLQEKPE